MRETEKMFEILEERRKKIDAAPDTPLAVSDAMRDMAAFLHPAKQYLKVREILRHKDAKSFVLEPDVTKGTYRIAPFQAGQYLSLQLKIGDSVLTRPISISAGPIEAVQANAYTITVKEKADGFASTYILENWQVGTEVVTSAPLGTFGYEPVRDAKHVIGIAGGSGITPFRSMASAIADGYDDYALTILYGCRTEEDILFKEDFDAFMARSEKIRVVYVLSDVEAEGYAHGLIHAGLIAKYLPKEPPFSFFICGPKGLYDFIGGQLAQFHMPSKYIRYELFGPQLPANHQPNDAGQTFSVTVHMRGEKRTISANANETVLVALERAGIAAPSHCRSGECGFCRTRLISGEVVIPDATDGRRLADKKFGYIHPCCTYPTSDLVIEL